MNVKSPQEWCITEQSGSSPVGRDHTGPLLGLDVKNPQEWRTAYSSPVGRDHMGPSYVNNPQEWHIAEYIIELPPAGHRPDDLTSSQRLDVKNQFHCKKGGLELSLCYYLCLYYLLQDDPLNL